MDSKPKSKLAAKLKAHTNLAKPKKTVVPEKPQKTKGDAPVRPKVNFFNQKYIN